MRRQGIVRQIEVGRIRSFDRTFKIKKTGMDITKTIKAPSRILWGLDLLSQRKKKKRR